METVVTEIIWRYYPGEKNVMSKFSGDNIKDHAHKSNVASIKFFGDIQEHISTEDVQADVTMKDLTAAPIVAPIVMEADNDAPIDEVDTAVVWDYKIICKMISRYIKLQKQDKLRQDPNQKVHAASTLATDSLIAGDIKNIFRLFASTQDEEVYNMLLMAGRKAEVLESLDHRYGVPYIWQNSTEFKERFKERFLHEYWQIYWDENVFKENQNP